MKGREMYGLARIAARARILCRAPRAMILYTPRANLSKFDDREKAQEQQFVYAREKELIEKLKKLLEKREKEIKLAKGDEEVEEIDADVENIPDEIFDEVEAENDEDNTQNDHPEEDPSANKPKSE